MRRHAGLNWLLTAGVGIFLYYFAPVILWGPE